MAPLMPGRLAAIHAEGTLAAASASRTDPVLVTLLCLAAVLLLALVVLSFNELRARRRRLAAEAAEERAPARPLPEGKIDYHDSDGTGALLISPYRPLSGRPDYVILSPEGMPIPVALKLTVTSDQAQEQHIIQLAAYLVILDDLAQDGRYDMPPIYGVLRYANQDVHIEFTEERKSKVLKRLEEMQRVDEQHAPRLKEQLASKCQICPFESICPIGQRQAR